jgi:large subunit ribosomal protein L22
MAITIDAPHARASARYLHVSPYKVRQVLDQIRGLSVTDAERILELSEKDAAGDVLKVLISAMANAEHNNQLPAEELYVARCWADEGPTRKWGQARARGRYFRIRKRTSHITLVVARYDEDRLEEIRRVEEMSGRGAAVQQRRRAERVRRSRAAAEPEAHDHEHEHEHEHEAPEASEAVVEEIEELEEEIATGEADIEAVDEVDDEAEAEPEAEGEKEETE